MCLPWHLLSGYTRNFILSILFAVISQSCHSLSNHMDKKTHFKGSLRIQYIDEKACLGETENQKLESHTTKKGFPKSLPLVARLLQDSASTVNWYMPTQKIFESLTFSCLFSSRRNFFFFSITHITPSILNYGDFRLKLLHWKKITYFSCWNENGGHYL